MRNAVSQDLHFLTAGHNGDEDGSRSIGKIRPREAIMNGGPSPTEREQREKAKTLCSTFLFHVSRFDVSAGSVS